MKSPASKFIIVDSAYLDHPLEEMYFLAPVIFGFV